MSPSPAKKSKTKIKKLAKTLLTLSAYILIIVAIMAWQERHLLNRQTDAQSAQILLPSLEGKAYQLAESGQKQLIYFFAPWCNICHLSISNIESQKSLLTEKGIQVLYVALSWQDKTEIKRFVKEHKLSSPVLLGTQQVAQDYKVKGFPTYYFINEQGIAESGAQGYSSELGVWLRSL